MIQIVTQIGMKMLNTGQLVQKAEVVPKAEGLRACFGLRKWTVTVDTSCEPRRSCMEVPSMKEGVRRGQ